MFILEFSEHEKVSTIQEFIKLCFFLLNRCMKLMFKCIYIFEDFQLLTTEGKIVFCYNVVVSREGENRLKGECVFWVHKYAISKVRHLTVRSICKIIPCGFSI